MAMRRWCSFGLRCQSRRERGSMIEVALSGEISVRVSRAVENFVLRQVLETLK